MFDFICVLISNLFSIARSAEPDNDLLITFGDELEDASGDDSDGNDNNLSTALILAIVATSLVTGASLLFMASCLYYKLKGRRINSHFIPMTNDDEIMNMADHDEVRIQNGKLSLYEETTSTLNESTS